MDIKKFIDYLQDNTTVSEAENQGGAFTKDHVIYNVEISREDGRTLETTYQVNPRYSVPDDAKNIIYCILRDAETIEEVEDKADFIYTFGYNNDAESIRNGLKAWRGCKKAAKQVRDFFSAEELEGLYKYYEEY